MPAHCLYSGRYNESFRLVGPKEVASDLQSRHVDAMEGGVFAVDLRKEDLLRFTNAMEEEEEDSLIWAQFLTELAAAAGALQCYVTYNEYLLRHDPNRSPFTGVPLIDTQRLFEFIRASEITGVVGQRFPLPFDFAPLEKPFFTVEPVDDGTLGSKACEDFLLASESACAGAARTYMLTLGDATDDCIMRLRFVPKTGASGAKGVVGRQDYRLLKRRKVEGDS
jgi:hypothetical protein